MTTSDVKTLFASFSVNLNAWGENLCVVFKLIIYADLFFIVYKFIIYVLL